KTLYYAGNVLFKTLDGGNSWQIISPDLTRETYDVPSSVGIYTTNDMKTMPRRGVIYTVAPSYKDINTIWCGTDDGLIHVTRDGGKTWKNVTPPEITSWSKVSLMDASHFDANTAYAAVNRIRCDDMRAHIYKTNDGGKTWKEIVNGLPNDPINVVREDPMRKGLLFAGSERAVYVSFDDGANWQSLRLNMPATSIRDLVIKDDDLVIGTHGRSFWILDNITPLRQLNNQVANSSSILYKPQNTYRVRWNMYTDTPVPQEEAAGDNPPDGVIIDYYLPEKAKKIELKIGKLNSSDLDLKAGRIHYTIIRKYSNEDTLYTIGNVNIPHYWIREQKILSAEPGHHRFTWDMKYAPLNIPPSYPISATYMNTERDQTAPWIMPGTYIVELVIDGKAEREIFTIKMDPRVKTSTANLQQQHDLSLHCYNGRKECMKILEEIRSYRSSLKNQIPNSDELGKKDKEAAALESTPQGSPAESFTKINGEFASIFNILQDSDMPPTTQTIAAFKEADVAFKELKKKWDDLKK
ncbi:MAG TPA: hypothetical protein VGQ04_11540, partial [Chitinophagaceae bacterium]|nr:hypothetical protein [Chitinophagaceae bacterium]